MVVLIPTLNLFSKSVATRSGASQAPEAPKFTPNNARMQELPGAARWMYATLKTARNRTTSLGVEGLKNSASQQLFAHSIHVEAILMLGKLTRGALLAPQDGGLGKRMGEGQGNPKP